MLYYRLRLAVSLLVISSFPLMADQSQERLDRPLFVTGFAWSQPDFNAVACMFGYNINERWTVGGYISQWNHSSKEIIFNDSIYSIGESKKEYKNQMSALGLRFYPFEKSPFYVSSYVNASDKDVEGDQQYQSYVSLSSNGLRQDSFSYQIETGRRYDLALTLGINWIFKSGFTITAEFGVMGGGRSKHELTVFYDWRAIAFPATQISVTDAALLYAVLKNNMKNKIADSPPIGPVNIIQFGWSFVL